MGGKGKGGRDHLPYFPHWLLPQIPPWAGVTPQYPTDKGRDRERMEDSELFPSENF